MHQFKGKKNLKHYFCKNFIFATICKFGNSRISSSLKLFSPALGKSCLLCRLKVVDVFVVKYYNPVVFVFYVFDVNEYFFVIRLNSNIRDVTRVC